MASHPRIIIMVSRHVIGYSITAVVIAIVKSLYRHLKASIASNEERNTGPQNGNHCSIFKYTKSVEFKIAWMTQISVVN